MRNTSSSLRNSEKLFSRKFGQVFLRNPGIARFEAESLELSPGSTVIEIGPGKGILTAALLEQGYRVIAVESDHRWVAELMSLFSGEIEAGMLEIRKSDFLAFPPGETDGLAGNIPYSISSDIIFRLPLFHFKSAVLMVQEEFAYRLVAKPGTPQYSRLTVNAQLKFHISILRKVSRRSFYPMPRVDSAVIRIIPREIPVKTSPNFDSILSKFFSNRRKKIGTTFPNAPDEFRNKRVEEIGPDDLIPLINQLDPDA
ncbi:16S rRNA (adenine(1518)-N(6)/adenine(1519)-N(6))-dimethyltransferase RsmA [Thermoplasmatales archaeon AK]|nr:16S rRNA (adenine(1518)-N(6)/adenine(1519)-N(6))-dimethyltransferase RsmA [Thermoplasmatales archaeon AK]